MNNALERLTYGVLRLLILPYVHSYNVYMYSMNNFASERSAGANLFVGMADFTLCLYICHIVAIHVHTLMCYINYTCNSNVCAYFLQWKEAP